MTVQEKRDALKNYCSGLKSCHECIFTCGNCSWNSDDDAERMYELLVRNMTHIKYPSERVCEINIKDSASMNSIVQALGLNGYECQVSPVWKEYPHSGLDHWAIRIGKKVCE